MRDKRMFQLSSGPRGKYVYHRSPSGRKVTRNVPNSVVTKNDAVRFLRESGGRGATRAQTPTKYVSINRNEAIALMKAAFKVRGLEDGIIEVTNDSPVRCEVHGVETTWGQLDPLAQLSIEAGIDTEADLPCLLLGERHE